jgi:phenylacetate-CoA ligase
MGFSETIYGRLPACVQNAAVSLEGLRLRRLRYGGNFESVLAGYEARSMNSEEEFRAFSLGRLAYFLRYAAERSVHYSGLASGVNELSPEGALAAFTVLKKDDVRRNLADICTPARKREPRTTLRTSGTTGAGLVFPATVRALREQFAVCWRFRRWHGIGRDTWCGSFIGRRVVNADTPEAPFWRNNVFGRQVLFSSFHLSEKNLPQYVAELRRLRLPWLHGYPSALAVVGQWLSDRRTDLGYVPRWITTSSETLLAHQSDVIRRGFGTRPFQYYGLTEGTASFSECPRGRLHVDEDYAYVEFLPAAVPGDFRVVGTCFSNGATPLIRYDAGDVVTLALQRTCPCGRPGRIVAAVSGRVEDYIVLADGSQVGRLDHVFKDQVNVSAAQIYQRAAGEILIRIVKGRDFSSKDEGAVLQALNGRLGSRARVRLEYVGEIARGANGKQKLVVSEEPAAVSPIHDHE